MNLIKQVSMHLRQCINFDRMMEKEIYKSIELYHRGDIVNKLRGVLKHNSIRRKSGCSIWPGIELGQGTYIAHAQNIYIGKTTIIGDKCRIYPGCYIMAALKGDNDRWENAERRHAKIGNNCILGAGCMIIGPITIGDDVFIGARAIVTKDIPSHTLVKNVNEITYKGAKDILSV